MGFFKSNNRYKDTREQDDFRTRPGASAASFGSVDKYQPERLPGAGHFHGPKAAFPHGNDSVTSSSGYQHHSNNATSLPKGNRVERVPYRNGALSSNASFHNGSGINRSDSFETNYNNNHFGSALWNWIPRVSQSADDATVVDRVKSVFVFTEQFVNNFYSDQTYEHEVPDGILEKVNHSPLYPTARLRHYLSKADCQTSLIKHTLVSLLLDLIAFDSTSSTGTSLLPAEFQNYNAIASARTLSTASGTDMSDIQSALSSYRVLSSYIRSDVESDSRYLQERQQVIEEVIRNFESAFRFWTVEERTQIDRQAALGQLLSKVGGLGIFLFSQPSVFIFNWEMTRQDQSDHLVPVWPRLLKVYDEEAQHREIADHLIPMRYGVMFRKPPNEQTLARAASKAANRPTPSTLRSDQYNNSSNQIQSEGNGSVMPGPNPDIIHTTPTRTMYQAAAATYNRESISPLNSDDEGSDRSWISHDALNIPQQISSTSRLHQEPNLATAAQAANSTTNVNTQQSVTNINHNIAYNQPNTTPATAPLPPVLTPGTQGMSEHFRTDRSEQDLRLPNQETRSTQSLPQQQPRVLIQTQRASTEDYNRVLPIQGRTERPMHARAVSNDYQQQRPPQPYQTRNPQNQPMHSTQMPNPILPGEQPPPYSSPIPTQGRERFPRQPDNNNNITFSQRGPLNQSTPTTFPFPSPFSRHHHTTRSSDSSLPNPNAQFSRTGQDQLYFPPPPGGTQRPRRDSFSKFMRRRSSSASKRPDLSQLVSRDRDRDRERDRGGGRERDRDRDRDGGFYPPNAYNRFGSAGYEGRDRDRDGGSERAGRSTERRSDGGSDGGGRMESRSRKRSSSLASSVRSFLMGDR